MFSKFKELFASESLLDSAFNTTLKMLEFDYKMFNAAKTVLRESDGCELPFDIKQTDRKINKYEREVRRNVLTHLTVAGTQNLVPGMVLVSIVISVERIGDYTKNIVDLARRHENQLKGASQEKDICKIEAAIAEHFPQTIEIISNQDKKLARSVMQSHDDLSRLSDRIVYSIIEEKETGLSTTDAVCIALYARYLKRINSHLTTIASAIVNPFPRIGFREKK